MIIGIDGPAGSGKSSITKIFESKYGFLNLNTGATYRTLAVLLLKKGYTFNDFKNVSPETLELEENILLESDVLKILSKNTIDIQKVQINDDINADDSIIFKDKILLNGEDISNIIRDEEVSKISSKISMFIKIKKALVLLQQQIAEKMLKENPNAKGIIAEGRDICTLVFKDAEIKIYLDALPEVRAKRRYEEYLMLGNTNQTYEEILENILNRDKEDKGKKYGALICTKEHQYIDTSDLNKEEVINKIIDIYNSYNV